ncbi:MAG: OsmC family protein [Dehalococcoidia bacterium]|nr:OsmC family protein [Dehalococcoidia bacterium]
MYGTLAGALAARKVEFDRSNFTADVEGTIEGAEKETIRITKIHVRYNLSVPASQRETAERALQVHPAGCPAHESVKDAIAIDWSADINET